MKLINKKNSIKIIKNKKPVCHIANTTTVAKIDSARVDHSKVK